MKKTSEQCERWNRSFPGEMCVSGRLLAKPKHLEDNGRAR